MEKRIVSFLILLVFIAVMVLTGCSTSGTNTTTSGDFTPMSVSSSDCNYGGEIKSVEAVDQYSVRFTLCRPDSAFPAKIAAPIFAIQDQQFLDENGGDSAKLSIAPNGTGSYIVKDWSPNYALTLVPSLTYWSVPAVTNKIEIRWQPSTNNRFSDYDFGSIEGLDFPAIRMTKPFSLIHYIYTNKDLQLVPHDMMNLYYLGINNKISPFNKVEVRQALATLLDRKTLIDDNFPSGTELAQQIIPSFVQPGRSLTMKWYEYKPFIAQTALNDAGFDFNQEITLAFVDSPMQSLYSPSALAEEIKAQMEAIGMKVTLKSMPLADFQASITSGQEMLFLYWFMVDYLDASAFFEKPFFAQQSYFGNPYPEIQSFIYDVEKVADGGAQQAIYDQLNQMVMEEVPLIPLGHSPNLSIFSSKMIDVSANTFYENLEDITTPKDILRYVGAHQPQSLWPADEDDYSTFRFTRLLYDTLLVPGFGGVDFEPLLAENWGSNSDLTEWTFQLRYNVQFSNGATFDANDVIASFAAIWDASNPNHVGRMGEFAMFHRLFGNMINVSQ